MALDNLKKKYKDLEEVLTFLEEASESFDRIAAGRRSDREAETIEEAVKEALEEDVQSIYVREADVTLSRVPIDGSESIPSLIDKVENELGGYDPVTSLVREISKLSAIICENPNVLLNASPDALAGLLYYLRMVLNKKKE